MPAQFLYNQHFSIGSAWIGLGGYLGFLLNGTIKNTQLNESLQFEGSNSEYNRIDLGMSTTAGFIFKQGIIAGVDYQLGLMNVANSGFMLPNPKAKLKNNTWSIYLGYEFKLK